MNARMSERPGGEVDEPVQQPGHQEEQGTQAEQREGVGGEHDEGLAADPEDRRDRVQREEDVGGSDRQQHEKQRGEDAAALARG